MDEKDATHAETHEKTSLLHRTRDNRFWGFLVSHKKTSTAAGLMLLLPLIALVALRNRGARADFTSPIVLPARKLIAWMMIECHWHHT